MYQYITKILPKNSIQGYRDLLRYYDIKVDYDKFIGFVIIFGLLIAASITIFLFLVLSIPLGYMFFLTYIGFYFGFEFAVYMLLSLSVDSRAKTTEKILPDALQMMAMNIKAGMTTDRALLLTARPEFGPLEKELNRAGKNVLAGMEISQALMEIPERIKSPVLERTIKMIVEGIRSGGELSDLLQETSEDIQDAAVVKGEVQSSVLMYAIFIFFAAGIGAPLLYGISTYLVGVLSTQFTKFEGTDIPSGGLNIMGGDINISQEFLLMFPIISLIITSIFGSLIIGIVKNGTEKDGVKIIPILLALSMAIFFIVRSIVSGIFSGMV